MVTTNDEWGYHNPECGCIYPTAKCPAEGIKEWNENRFRLAIPFYSGGGFPPGIKDPYITIEMFEAFRKGTGYTDEQIRNEVRLIYSRKEYDAFYKG